MCRRVLIAIVVSAAVLVVPPVSLQAQQPGNLVERLMGWPGAAKIQVHDFWSYATRIIHGQFTVAALKTRYNMNAAAQSQLDSLAAIFPTGTTAIAVAQKSMFLNCVHAVLLIAESREDAALDTPAEVQSAILACQQ